MNRNEQGGRSEIEINNKQDARTRTLDGANIVDQQQQQQLSNKRTIIKDHTVFTARRLIRKSCCPLFVVVDPDCAVAVAAV